MKSLKMYTKAGKWIVMDGDWRVEFEQALDAWCFVLLLKVTRPRVPCIKSLYPVKTLDPRPSMRKKKITFIGE